MAGKYGTKQPAKIVKSFTLPNGQFDVSENLGIRIATLNGRQWLTKNMLEYILENHEEIKACLVDPEFEVLNEAKEKSKAVKYMNKETDKVKQTLQETVQAAAETLKRAQEQLEKLEKHQPAAIVSNE